MYWIKSTNDFSHTMAGHLIPRMHTPNNDYLEANEDVYKELKEIPVFNALVKSGGIVVFTKRPSDIQDPPELIKKQQKNLEDKNARLEEELAELRKQLIRKEGELREKDKELKKAERAEKAGKKGSKE